MCDFKRMESDLKDAKYIFYHVIGRHADEEPDAIIQRKKKEIDEEPDAIIQRKKNEISYNLWAAFIPEWDKKFIWNNLGESDEVYVLCKVRKNSKQPGDDPDKTKTKTAKTMSYIKDGEKIKEDIPEKIKCTYNHRGEKYGAYVVEDIKIPFEGKGFRYFSKYKWFNAGKEEWALYKDGLNEKHGTQWQNRLGIRNDDLSEEAVEKGDLISYVLKLKYPFVVDIE